DIDSGTATDVASAIARQFGTGVDAARLAVITTASIMGVAPTPDLIAGLTQDPATAAFTANITGLDADIRQLDGVTYITAGMAIFFLFFTVQAGVLGLLDEEREGTLRRLMAAPVPRAAVIGGKGLLALILGVFALTTLVVASSLIMGASWGHPLGVAIMILTGVAAAVSLMGVVAGLAKSPEGAENLAAITAVILGMLGGVFFPIESAGGALAAASVITPHYWFLRGLGDLAGGAPWTNAFPAAAVLIGMAVVLGLAAGWVLNRRFAE
ncbi:MAG: ABC transporter permease, partial [Acidimicrobiales bacterium]|nr:ABC transporter permease [Acidimicrobiales bacterium]